MLRGYVDCFFHGGSDLFRAHRFRDRRFGGHSFRVCAAAFAINYVASSSARGLADGG
jgi:hypothetical protein